MAQIARDLGIADSTLHQRHPPAGLLHHSDRGSECTSDRYLTLLAELGIEVSMSRTANCYDNAAMESFFATLTRVVY